MNKKDMNVTANIKPAGRLIYTLTSENFNIKEGRKVKFYV